MILSPLQEYVADTYITWDKTSSLLYFMTGTSLIDKKTAEQNFRRSGGLPMATHEIGRSMTLRPRLATGLPFRYQYNYMSPTEKGKKKAG